MTATPKPATKKLPRESSEVPKAFPVVGIGSSAGGLEAMTELLKYLETDTGMAYIYVQHLSPDHKSMLTSLLAKATSIKVQEGKNKMLIAPNNMYVIPPDKEMTVSNGYITITPRPDTPRINLPIDILFCSIAEAYRENAIGIILSGSANDGTRGMQCIKQDGGLTFAQDDTAKFNSMPDSAIAAGAVDFILPPKEIALELVRLSKHPFMQKKALKGGYEELIDDNNPKLRAILNLMHATKEVDFSAYKMRTIKRRIIRRMLMYKMKELHEYANFISKNPSELDILYQDMLINVTSFFRDSEANKYLKTTLLPKLLKNTPPGKTLRIWVPACSTGEEAYSIAMMLVEIQSAGTTQVPVQIFATDLSEKAIKKARIGLYSAQDLESVTPKRIQRFFSKSDDGFRISKSIRDMCLFAQHNVLTDPPFSRIDFISCRNLYIYLEAHAQKRSLANFHFALNEGGYLMLGKSETISAARHLFLATNKKFKVFSRIAVSGKRTIPDIAYRSTPIVMKQDLKSEYPKLNTGIKLSSDSPVVDNAIDSVLMSNFVPASVVINHRLDIIQFRGSTDLFLTHASGKATFSILKMVRPELVFPLRNAISEAINKNHRVKKSGIQVNVNNVRHFISFEIVPLHFEKGEPLLLIVFAELDQIAPYAHKESKGNPEKDIRIKQLVEEVNAAHADALVFSQQQEAIIEDLQIAHEEVVSSNEELQTVNEELETSKEEFESANEELIATNQELQTRIELLNEAYEFSNAIISTVHEPVVVLDKELKVKTANKSYYEKFGGKAEDTEGAFLFDLGEKQWDIPKLRQLIEEIIPKNTQFKNFVVTHDFPGIGKRTLELNGSRLLQKSHGEHLILISINDVTATMQLQQKEKDELKKDIVASKANRVKLEKAVKERTHELKEVNSTLAEKNAELLKANKELEAFSYVASHDLQEPLRKIQTFAGRILDTEEQRLSETGKDYFRRMRNAADQMQMLIKNLLSFSLISTGLREMKPIDLSIILEEVIADLYEVIAEKNATIEVNEMCTVRIIRFQFRQLLYNLISNALKFSRAGVSPHIIISCQTVKSGRKAGVKLQPNVRYCHISISDNGIGFSKEFSDKVFEVFQKLHGNDKYAGTGIGLAIVKQIVENHSGFITVKSELDKGTTFNIFIPEM